MTFTMKGLSKEADIHDYLVNKETRRKMYDDIVNTEISRFENELADMLKSITKTIDELKISIVSQLEEFKLSYQKVKLIKLRPKNLCSKKYKNAFPLAIWPITKLLRMFLLPKTSQTHLDFVSCSKS
jgi:hypothetical protein